MSPIFLSPLLVGQANQAFLVVFEGVVKEADGVKCLESGWRPVGVLQGWSPGSPSLLVSDLWPQ